MGKRKQYSINKRVTACFLLLFIAAAGLSTYYFLSFTGIYYDNGQQSFAQEAEDTVRGLDETVSILEHQMEWLASSANDTTYWMANSQYERVIHMRHMTENLRSFLQTSSNIEAVMIVQRNRDVVWESHTMDEACFVTFLNNYGRTKTVREKLPAVMHGYGTEKTTHWILTQNIVCYREDELMGQVVADIYVAVNIQSLLPQPDEDTTYLLCTRSGDMLQVISAYGANAQQMENQSYRVPQQAGVADVRIDNENYISFYGKPKAENLYLMILRPQKTFLTMLQPMILFGVVLIAVLLLIAIAGSRVIASYIRTPLDTMVKDLEQIASGDTDYRLELAEATEISKVTTGVNKLLDELDNHSATIMAQQKELYELELLHSESQLKSLQAQINPHFLYNTLECIRSISQHYGVGEISKIISGMIRIYRYSASHVSQGTVESEFSCADAYAQIVQVRYEGRYNIVLDADPALNNCYMPKMILQPLIENAVNHGLIYRYSDGEVRVTAREAAGDILVTVADNGKGMKPEELLALQERLERGVLTESKKDSIGLNNVHLRIRKTFGASYGVQVESREDEGTTVYIRFPKSNRS